MGCVYILKNEAMPGLIKIGYTTRTAEERADELYEGITGVPMPFEVVHKYPCEEPQKLEREMHRRLTAHRINENREFFKYPADDAFQLLQELHKFSTSGWWRKWTSHFLTRFRKKADLTTDMVESETPIPNRRNMHE